MSNPTTPFYPMTHDDAQELIAAIGDNSKMAAAYDPTRTYELNDHCIYSGGLYRCTTAIAVAEQWTPAHWESITVGEELTETSKGLAKLIPVISGAVNNSGYTIASGDYFEADGNLYKATAAIPIGYAWASSGSAVSGTAINSLNSNLNVKVSSYNTSGSAPFTFQTEGLHVYLIYAISGASSHAGLWLVQGSSAGSGFVHAIFAGTALTASIGSDNVLTISKSSGRTTRFVVMDTTYD